MEITTIPGTGARVRMSALGLAAMGSAVPSYAAFAVPTLVKPDQHSGAANGGAGALDAWGPPV
jgi:hypothetical protein